MRPDRTLTRGSYHVRLSCSIRISESGWSGEEAKSEASASSGLAFDIPLELDPCVADDIMPISSQLPQTYIPGSVLQSRATGSFYIHLRPVQDKYVHESYTRQNCRRGEEDKIKMTNRIEPGMVDEQNVSVVNNATTGDNFRPIVLHEHGTV